MWGEGGGGGGEGDGGGLIWGDKMHLLLQQTSTSEGTGRPSNGWTTNSLRVKVSWLQSHQSPNCADWPAGRVGRLLIGWLVYLDVS